MSFELTLEVGALMNTYSEKVKPFESEHYDYDKERQKKKIAALYAQAIELNCRMGYGLIMPIDMAIDWVSGRYITDYDGIGDLLDSDGNEIGNMKCNVQFLEEAKEKGVCFVAWYNK